MSAIDSKSSLSSEMTYKNLGQSGLKVSSFSFGGWTTIGGSVKDAQIIRDILLTGYEAGINFFDNADIYARGDSEIAFGNVLSELPRHHLVLSSKVFWPMSENVNDKGLSRKHIFESIHSSLRRMKTDYFDIYFCHRFDSDTPLLETVRAMDDLIKQGKILYWGTSEWSGDQLRQVYELCDDGGFYPPQVEQPQYSLLVRDKFEQDVAPAAQDLGMGLVTWSPLASGFLTGKYDSGISAGRLSRVDWLREIFWTEANRKKVIELKTYSDEIGCSRSQLALAWASSHRGVSSVILGATSPQQLKENLGALKVQIPEKIRSYLNAWKD